MSLADRIETISPKSRDTCITCIWYDNLPDRDKAAFDQLLEREDISKAHLLDFCRPEGLKASEASFRRHLKNHHGSR